MENLKLQLSKKLNEKILDFKNVNYGMEYEVEIIKGKDRGNALLKIFGPNNKKKCRNCGHTAASLYCGVWTTVHIPLGAHSTYHIPHIT